MKRPRAGVLHDRAAVAPPHYAPDPEIAMKLKYALCLMLAPWLAFAGVAAAADEFSPAQKQELGAFVKDYLVGHPEVLRAALATRAASTEPGPSTGKSFRTRRRFGSSFISLAMSGRAPLQKWQL